MEILNFNVLLAKSKSVLLLRKSFLLCLVMCTSGVLFSQNIFSNKLHEIRITTDREYWFDTLQSYYNLALNGAPQRFIPTHISIDGVLLDSVGLRFKGKYSNYGFPGRKKPLRLDFNKFLPGQDFQGLKKLNLHNLAGDPSFLREYMAYDLFRYLGIPASRVSFCRLYIDDIYWGCYEIVEEPDKQFLNYHFRTKKGNLFEAVKTTGLKWKGDSPASYPELELKTDSAANSWDHLISWMDLFNNDYSMDYNQQLHQQFDVDNFMRIQAVDVLINNHDCYASNGRNFFLYDAPGDQQIHWIPWDYNLSFWSASQEPIPQVGGNGYQPFIQRMKDHSFLAQTYLSQFCKLLDNEFRSYPFDERAAEAFNLIRTAVEEDTLKFYSTEAFYRNLNEAVIVNMLRNNVPTNVYLPGISYLFRQRKTELRKALFVAGCNCDDLKDSDELSATLYPNPAQDVLHLYIEDDLMQDSRPPLIEFKDLNGRLLHSERRYPQSGRYDFILDDFQKGVYYIHITGFSKSFIKKWIKN